MSGPVTLVPSTELELLVGEAEAMPCESPHHTGDGNESHDDGPATHYYMMMHDCSWLDAGQVYAGCSSLAKLLPGLSQHVNCLSCGQQRLLKDEWIRVIGPVGT